MIRLYDIYAFVQNLNICKTQYTKSTECMMCRKKKKERKKKHKTLNVINVHYDILKNKENLYLNSISLILFKTFIKILFYINIHCLMMTI